MKPATFYSFSFGCRVNEAEKEEIDRKMAARGFKFDKNKPDIFIINSCSVTSKADREARQLVYQTKKRLPESKIVVTGCAATYWQKNRQAEKIPADLIIDNVNKEYLVDIIRKRLINKNVGKFIGVNEAVSNKFIGSGRIMIKIQDGCQRFCTFCIVPYLRGMPKSSKISEIVKKIKQLAKQNRVKEVVLTAINTQAFGFDSKESFIDLLKSAIDQTDIPKISLGSVHPWSVNDDFFTFYRQYAQKKRLADFFHIPLQSGSNKILGLMKRGYTREEFVSKLRELGAINQYALIATDIIVGFLEESEADFQDTYNFLKESPINKFHVFRFSRRAKTSADYMARRLKEPTAMEKEDRAEALIKLGQKKLSNFLRKNVGRSSSVLFLEKTFNSYREGLLDNQLPIFVSDQPGNLTAPGNIRRVKIMDFKKGRLFGKID